MSNTHNQTQMYDQMQNGKGDKRRPMKVSWEEWEANWIKAFLKEKDDDEQTNDESTNL